VHEIFAWTRKASFILIVWGLFASAAAPALAACMSNVDCPAGQDCVNISTGLPAFVGKCVVTPSTSATTTSTSGTKACLSNSECGADQTCVLEATGGYPAVRGRCVSPTPGTPAGAVTTPALAPEVFTYVAPKLAIPIPYVNLTDAVMTGNNITIPFLAQYISGIYTFMISIVGLLAAIMMIIGGFTYLTSAGDNSKITAGRKRIVDALIGLVLAFGSYVILYIINPNLVTFSSLQLASIETRATGRDTDLLLDPQSAAGGGGNPAPEVHGKGDFAAADATQCPDLTPGTKFKAAFTTYYNVSSTLYGQAGSYKGIYKGANASLQGMGDFFCAIAMECGCPKQLDLTDKNCNNGKRAWYPCKYFSSDVKYCDNNPKQYRAGETVAGSSCFNKGCQIKVNGHNLTVTDRGAAIIGTHFDFYIGTKGTADYPADTSWLSSDAEMVSCPGPISAKDAQYLRVKYEQYKPGVCKPGINC
jgi:hypothetical protein